MHGCRVGKRGTHQSLCLQLHGHAVVSGVADGGLVVDAVGGDDNERVIGFEDLCDGLALADCTDGEQMADLRHDLHPGRAWLSGHVAYT